VISGSVKNGQTANCWIVIRPDGDFAFIANTGSNTVSSYSIGSGGELTLLAGAAAETGAGSMPIDMAMARGGRVSLRPE